jgi:hypothetical protein
MKKILFLMGLACGLNAQAPGDCPETATQITECGITYTGNNSAFTDNCGGNKCGCVGGGSNPSNFDNSCLTVYPGGNCGSDFAGSIENSMWWSFTPTEDCDYEISVTPYNCCCAQGNGPDYMQVWIGQMNGGLVTSYLVNDNSNNTLTGGNTVTYTVPVTQANGDVLIMLDGNAGAECDIDISIQPAANCGDLCPILLGEHIRSFKGEIKGITAQLNLETTGTESVEWTCEWSPDGIWWNSLGSKVSYGADRLTWFHLEWGQSYYRVKRDGMVSNIIALWNPHIGERIIKRYYTTTGLVISDIETYNGMYIVEWQDGGRELRCK